MTPIDSEFPFPRTPHLPGSAVVDDDRCIAPAEIRRLCETCDVVVQEKLDGANGSIFFESEGQPIVQKRSGRIGQHEKEQYNRFRSWTFEHASALWAILDLRWVAFAELLWSTHSIHYDRLPDYVIFYDLRVRSSGQYARADAVAARLGPGFAVVPTLWRGRLRWPFDPERDLRRFLAGSAFRDGPPEGLYLRFESDERLVARAKYRLPTFVPGWQGGRRRNRIAQ
jgi:hypothetical protein